MSRICYPRGVNKHGFPGVRKRMSPQHWRKPYYARVSDGCEKFRYSRNFATVEEAAAAYWELKFNRPSGGPVRVEKVE